MKSILTAALLLGLSAASAVTLPNPNCPGDARCTFSNERGAYGTVGEGAPFSLGGFSDRVGSGFVDEKENALYVPFEAGGQLDAYGAIIRVDLKTGNRTLVSGAVDELESRGKGVTYTSDRGSRVNGWDLGNIYAVRPGPDGSLYALVDKLGDVRTEVLRINRVTGDRTIVWASKLADDASLSSNPDAIQSIEKRLGITPENTCERTKPFISLEVDPQNGDVLLMSRQGLMRVTPGKSCSWVSRWDSAGSLSGSGPVPAFNVVGGTTLQGRELSVTSGPGNTGLYTFNIDTGERRITSLLNSATPSRSVGKGELYIGFLGGVARQGNTFLTTGYTSQRGFAATAVDASGNRSLIEPSGSLSRYNENNMAVVAALPGTNTYVIWYGKALHVLNVDTKTSYVLSH